MKGIRMTSSDDYWQGISTQLQALEIEAPTIEQVDAWLQCWDDLMKSIDERYTLLKRAKYQNIHDTAADQTYNAFCDTMQTTQQAARRVLSQKLLSLPNYAPPPHAAQLLRRLHAESDLYHPANIALQAEINALANTYRDLSWKLEKQADDAVAALQSSRPLSSDELRQLRAQHWFAERETLNRIMLALLSRRRQLARHVGLPNYLMYRWRELYRLDYTPDDSKRFHSTIARYHKRSLS